MKKAKPVVKAPQPEYSAEQVQNLEKRLRAATDGYVPLESELKDEEGSWIRQKPPGIKKTVERIARVLFPKWSREEKS